MTGREQTWDERTLQRAKPSVDPTLIAQSLRLTPTQRLARLQEMIAFVEMAHRRSRHAVPRNSRDTDHQ